MIQNKEIDLDQIVAEGIAKHEEIQNLASDKAKEEFKSVMDLDIQRITTRDG